MSKKEKNEEQLIDVEQTLSSWEKKIEQNKKSYGIVLGLIILVVAIYFAWAKLYVAPQEARAQTLMFHAERYFAVDSLDKALYGDGNYLGFNDIINEFGVTSSANLSHYYMGIGLLRKGEFEEAIKHLNKFSSNDHILSSVAIGAIGDAHAELGNMSEAADNYKKAARNNEDKFTAPIYLMRAGLAYESLGNYSDAENMYVKIKENYSETTEGREIEKYIARSRAAQGIK
ncbi:MAG: tetratricopeptide repeat protein [Bacteroidetes bacterium]|nr:tetratricopeptide repeat protein [Bacteroidota bacterium]